MCHPQMHSMGQPLGPCIQILNINGTSARFLLLNCEGESTRMQLHDSNNDPTSDNDLKISTFICA